MLHRGIYIYIYLCAILHLRCRIAFYTQQLMDPTGQPTHLASPPSARPIQTRPAQFSPPPLQLHPRLVVSLPTHPTWIQITNRRGDASGGRAAAPSSRAGGSAAALSGESTVAPWAQRLWRRRAAWHRGS